MANLIELSHSELQQAVGFGVAGNFAGHLEQAGEAEDFKNVAAETGAPKGIFPYYIPGRESFLGIYPLSFDTIAVPPQRYDLQIEPEVALLCNLRYDSAGLVSDMQPIAFGAYNDCSIRRPGAKKISEKKNWGPDSKGCAPRMLRLDGFEPGCITDHYRLVCYLKRGADVYAYGQDSPLVGYSYYYGRLINWTVDRLRFQEGASDTPLEAVGQYIRDAGMPSTALVSIGATRYTEFGEKNYLSVGDLSYVVVYDGRRYASEEVADMVGKGELPREHLSVLEQVVA